MKVKPLLRGHFHQAMFFVAIGACFPLMLRSHSGKEFVGTAVYSVCVFLMFGISAVYHRVTWTPEQRALWKKFDHCGIYLMIAGNFTPIALLGLPPEEARTLLLTIWGVATVGIIQSIFFVKMPKIVSALIYMFAGYTILPYAGHLQEGIGTTNLWLILSGGIVYSIGALGYGLKRPVLYPEVFGYHELFHVFVNIGAILHFLVINSLVP